MIENGPKPGIEAHANVEMLEALSRHACEGCGGCCRWRGHVYIYASDIKRIATELQMSEAEFLLGYCKIVYWPWAGSRQFRVALTRNAAGECVFLKNLRCTIHAFKPLMCKAGPAAWPWINNSKAFWFYVQRSPSFLHPLGTMPMAEANCWFTATRDAEAEVGVAKSVMDLACILRIPESVLQCLPLMEFKEEEEI
jgi:Fe-S-cluster containining protein